MVPDRQKVRTDGRNGRTDRRMDDAKTISLRLRRGIINCCREGGANIKQSIFILLEFSKENDVCPYGMQYLCLQRTCNGLAVFWPTMDLAEI